MQAFVSRRFRSPADLQFSSRLNDNSQRNKIVRNLNAVVGHLRWTIEALPHKGGVDRWHAMFLEKLIAVWNEGQQPDDFDVFWSILPGSVPAASFFDFTSLFRGNKDGAAERIPIGSPPKHVIELPPFQLAYERAASE